MKSIIKKHKIITVLLILSIAITVPDFSKIKNTLLLRFASPKTYMTYVETNYLRAEAKNWQEKSKVFSSLFENMDLTGAKIDVKINHLLTSLLKGEADSANSADLSGISLLLLTDKKEELSLFELSAQIDEATLASLDFLSDSGAGRIYIACPQAGEAAISAGGDSPKVMLLYHLSRLLQALPASVNTPLSPDPYTCLLPYLKAVTKVSLKHGVTVPATDAALTGNQLDMQLPLNDVLDIANMQLTFLKSASESTNPLLSYYEFIIWLLTCIDRHYPAELFITAYIDNGGGIIGHEFSIRTENNPILSLTGILTPSKSGGKSGELTLFSSIGGQPLTILLSVSQFDFDMQTGLFTGKINISFDRIPSIYFQLLFGSKDKMPELSLYVRSMGVAAALFEITPTDLPPASFPDPKAYSRTYDLTELAFFLKSLDFSGILSDFYNSTKIPPITLPSLPK